MSSPTPPGQPPFDPSSGPSGQHDSGGPEILSQGRGGPLPPGDGTRGGGGRRKAVWAGAAVAGVGLVGGAAFGAYWYLATGPQAAEALPAGALAYASIDLDPSGEQKLDALETLKKFPTAERELELDGDLSDIDVKKLIVEAALKEAPCDGITYQDDVEPWLGDRAAVAAVDLGEDEPAPVFALAVTDGAAAEKGLEALAACGGDEGEAPGIEISGDWALLAETDDIVDQVVEAADKGTLADDEDFQKWTGEAGDPGIVTMYVSPEAGTYLAENFGPAFGGVSSMSTTTCVAEAQPAVDAGESDGTTTDGDCVEVEEAVQSEVPEELRKALEDFEGMAATVRFDDGALEVESAGGAGIPGVEALYSSDRGGDAVAALPEDTAVALGLSFEEGWFEDLLEYAATTSGMEADEVVSEIESATGLELPEDAETLVGESIAFAVSGDLDPQAVFESEDGSDIPAGVVVEGDAAEIEDVLEKLRTAAGEEGAVFLGSSSEGGTVAIAPSEDYREQLLGSGDLGDLGDSEKYQDVVRESEDASAVLYVDADRIADLFLETADDGMDDDDEVRGNLEPLAAFGVSAWEDDGVIHGVFRLTTD